MLDGLDKIDWSKLRHAYGSAEHTPEFLRALISPDQAKRDVGYEHLYAAINHQGDISNATAAVVPFLLELLSYDSVPQRERILKVLQSFAASCDEHLGRVIYYKNEFKFGDLRQEIDTYNNICVGIDTYLSLLKHPQISLRKESASLLGLLPDQGERTCELLWQAIQAEAEDQVLIAMLEGFAAVVPNRWELVETEVEKQYISPLEELVMNHANDRVRLAAAIALVDMTTPPGSYRSPYAPPFIIEVLVDALNQPAKYRLSFMHEFILARIRKLEMNALVSALKLPGINAHVAHWLGREMLDRVFEPTGGISSRDPRFSWSSFEVYSAGSFNGVYNLPQQGGTRRIYQPGTKLGQSQRRVIQQIITSEPFWKMPTNLFSFFYGLPDDRQSLSQLVSD